MIGTIVCVPSMPAGFLVLALFAAGPARATPEDRAVAFLVREVPRWRVQNGCFSCHNNGDAARALLTAARASYKVPPEALAETLRWLDKPGQWEHNRGDERFSDKGLARIQFAGALLDVRHSAKDSAAVSAAAAILAQDQQQQGLWKAGTPGSVGSAITYGPILGTHFARSVLQRADAAKYADALGRAARWLRQQRPNNVLEAASLLLALADDRQWEVTTRRACLDLIREGQDADGGWGPYVTSGAEPFDTALVLLALVRCKENELLPPIRRGRAFLIASQEEDGGWPATTRPAGSGSYAHRISTTGWALMALLATK